MGRRWSETPPPVSRRAPPGARRLAAVDEAGASAGGRRSGPATNRATGGGRRPEAGGPWTSLLRAERSECQIIQRSPLLTLVIVRAGGRYVFVAVRVFAGLWVHIHWFATNSTGIRDQPLEFGVRDATRRDVWTLAFEV